MKLLPAPPDAIVQIKTGLFAGLRTGSRPVASQYLPVACLGSVLVHVGVLYCLLSFAYPLVLPEFLLAAGQPLQVSSAASVEQQVEVLEAVEPPETPPEPTTPPIEPVIETLADSPSPPREPELQEQPDTPAEQLEAEPDEEPFEPERPLLAAAPVTAPALESSAPLVPRGELPAAANRVRAPLDPAAAAPSAPPPAPRLQIAESSAPPPVQQPPATPPIERNDQPLAAVTAPAAMPFDQEAGVQVDEQPRPLPVNRPPLYPEAALRSGRQGKVILLASIDEQGRVSQLEVHQSSGHADLDAAALAAVRAWRFQPARRGNQPAAAQVLAPVMFSIRDR